MWTLERSHHSHKSGFSCGKFSIGTISVRSKIAIPNSGGQRDEPVKRKKEKRKTRNRLLTGPWSLTDGVSRFRSSEIRISDGLRGYFRWAGWFHFGHALSSWNSFELQLGITRRLGRISILEEFVVNTQPVRRWSGMNSESVQILNFKFQVLASSPVSRVCQIAWVLLEQIFELEHFQNFFRNIFKFLFC